MNSRERTLAALNHREPDRVPRDLGGTESSGLTAVVMVNLLSSLRVPAEIKIFEPYQYVAYVGDELKNKFNIDTANLTPEPKTWVKQRHPLGFGVWLPEKWREEIADDGATVIRRADGVIGARRPPGGLYFDSMNPPLQNIASSPELGQHQQTIFSFDYPSFADEPLEDMRCRAQAMHARGDCTVFNLCCHFLAAGQLLRGYENFMVDLLTDETLVRKLLDGLLEGYCCRVDQLAPSLKDCVDVVLLNDDLGTQQGPMLSPRTYRKIIKPYQKTFFGYIKKAFGRPILFHSCGAVRDFIPDLIEAGVDALNPVQLSAKDMALPELKREFGRDITFWGGGIDTQTVLNKKTAGEVEDAVKKNLDILAPGGGFVFCQVHNIQPDVPPANILSMYKALDEYGNY